MPSIYLFIFFLGGGGGGEREREERYVQRPHGLVSAVTVGRWLTYVMTTAGIDASVYRAHSVRGAASSVAARAGMSTADILECSDCAAVSTVRRFYLRDLPNENARKRVGRALCLFSVLLFLVFYLTFLTIVPINLCSPVFPSRHMNCLMMLSVWVGFEHTSLSESRRSLRHAIIHFTRSIGTLSSRVRIV